MSLRVIFFGNSESVFSNRHFAALKNTGCHVAAVVDVPPARRTSTNAGSPSEFESFVITAHTEGTPCFEPSSPNTAEFVRAMQVLHPDLFVAAGYMNLLKEEILSVPRIAAANLHASVLPAYRGKHPVFWALRNGERWVGLTVHVMDPSFDTGDILYQVRVRARKLDTVASAYDRIMDRSVPLIRRLISDAEQGKLVRKRQPGTGGSYYSSISEKDFALDWSLDAEELRRWIQTSPGQCFCQVRGRRVHFMDAQVAATGLRTGRGKVVSIGRTNCLIGARRKGIKVRRLSCEGVERAAAELFREMGLEEGAALQC